MADDLLSALTSNENSDEDAVLHINPEDRTIRIPKDFVFGVYNDKDVLAVPFTISRYYGENDLSDFTFTINYINAAGLGNIYDVVDLTVGEDRIDFMWTLGRAVFVTKGTVRFVVCIRKIGSNGRIEKELNTRIYVAEVLAGLEVDDNPDPEAYSILANMTELEASTKRLHDFVSNKASEIANITGEATRTLNEANEKLDEAIEGIDRVEEMFGSPLVAATVASMTDQTKVYVYTGSETGYTAGNWYYYNGSAWTSGGVYNSEGINTDTTLTIAGMAADAKATGDEITHVKQDISELESGKVNKPSTNPNGTNGQLLRTNGDGTTTWVDEGLPTDEQTAEAVSDWLDEHPEATTTVQDGAITMPKLNSSLKDVVVVEDTTEKDFSHDVAPTEVIIYPNAYTQDIPIRYAGSEDLFKDIPRKSGLQRASNPDSIYRTCDGRYTKLIGTGDGGLAIFDTTDTALLNKIKGKTITLCVYIKKASAWGNASYFALGDTSGSLKRQNYANGGVQGIGWNIYENVEMPSNITHLYFKFSETTGSSFAEGDFVWVAAYESSPIVTETTITDEPTTISLSGMSYVDTMMHESVAKHVVPTKTYVDEHTPDIIGYWSDNIYALPEDFGAVGDGVADDTTALANCISYAKTSGKPVRGYSKYKTTSTIALDGEELDVYIRDINYTGNGVAVSIQNRNVVFEFHKITSAGTGLDFRRYSDSRSAMWCQVKGAAVVSTSHCIEVKDYTYYNTVEVRKLESTSGDCLHRTVDADGNSSEYVFRSSTCSCQNGYVSNNIVGSKFYDFTIEGNCKYGLLNPSSCVCVGFRHREQVDRIKLRIVNGYDYNNGALIIFTTNTNGDGMSGLKYISGDEIPYYSVDLSAIQGYGTISSSVEDATSKWFAMGYSGIDLGTPIRGYDSSARRNIGKLYFIGNNKVYVPEKRSKVIVDVATVDFRLFDSMADADIISSKALVKYYATDFIIDISHVTMYFNASFGAIGHNDLTITQADGNTCTVYDKLGNVLFDGTNLGDGKWRLRCIIDESSMGRLEFTTAWWCYDGTNEFWEITKIE